MKTTEILGQVRNEAMNPPAIAYPYYVKMPALVFSGKEYKSPIHATTLNVLYQLSALRFMEGVDVKLESNILLNLHNKENENIDRSRANLILDELASKNIVSVYKDLFNIEGDRLLNWKLNYPVNAIRDSATELNIPLFLIFSRAIDLFFGMTNKHMTLLLYVLAKKTDHTHMTVKDFPISLLSNYLPFKNDSSSLLDKKKDLNNLLEDLKDLNVIQSFSFFEKARVQFVSFTFNKDETKYFMPMDEKVAKRFVAKQPVGSETYLNNLIKSHKPEAYMAKERIKIINENISLIMKRMAVVRVSVERMKTTFESLRGPADYIVKDYVLQLEAWKEIKRLFSEGLIIKESKLASLYKIGIKDITAIPPYEAIQAFKALEEQYQLNIARFEKDLDKLNNDDFSPLNADHSLTDAILDSKDVEADIIARRKIRKNTDFNQVILSKLSKKYKAKRKEIIKRQFRMKNPYLSKTDLDKRAMEYEQKYDAWFGID